MSLPLWARWIGVNLIFGVCHPWLAPALPASVRSVAIGAVLFLLPAAGWGPRLGGATRALGMRLARDVAISTCALFGFLTVAHFLAVTPTQALAWNTMWMVTNLGLICSVVARPKTGARRSLTVRDVTLGCALFFGGYGLYYWGATRVVPPQEDHDLEVQATGYGLLTRFEPFLLTDRHTIYYFAHPPLLHLYVGASFLYYGSFPDLEFFDAASRRAHAAREGRPFEPVQGAIRVGAECPSCLTQLKAMQNEAYRVVAVEDSHYVLAPEGGGPFLREPVEEIELALIYARYEDRPHRLATRTPNLFFAAATVALLGIWAGRISRSRWMGLLAAAAYATNPEVFVRSSYGGYFAIGGFAAILMLLAAESWRRRPLWHRAALPTVTGVLVALADHKLVLLPAAMGIRSAFTWSGPGRPRRLAVLLDPVVVGFALGTVVYWCFGLAIAPAAFIQDHFHYHLFDRIAHENPLGYRGYLTPLGLWLEFAQHTGYVLLPIGLFAMIYDLVRSRIRPVRGRRPLRGLWLLWTLLTAAVFTVIDWRMTKHLMPMLIPLYLGLVPDPDAPPWRTGLSLFTLLLMLVFNAWAVSSLALNFEGFQITPAW